MVSLEIVEEILIRLRRDGRINDGLLLKRDFMRETQRFIFNHKITHISYDDIMTVLLEYKYCYYDNIELGHSFEYFHVNTSMINTLNTLVQPKKPTQLTKVKKKNTLVENHSWNFTYIRISLIYIVDRVVQYTWTMTTCVFYAFWTTQTNEPVNIKANTRMKLAPLPDFDPSEEMKSLTRKNFVNLDLSEEEKCLLNKIDYLMRYGVTKLNYIEFWKTMIEMEDCAEIEANIKTGLKDQHLIKYSGFYELQFPKLSDNSSITEGTEVVITPSSCRQSHTKDPRNIIKARVHAVRMSSLVLKLKDNKKDGRLNTNVPYDIHFLPNRVTIQMQMQALNYVELHGISDIFFPDTISTHSIDFEGFEWINESVESNPEQQSAIMHIVGKSSFPAPYILMGPPGTGKTTTIVEAVCQIIKRDPDARILVAASSNYASDVIALRLLEHLSETCVYRMFSGSQERNIKSLDPRLLKASNLSDGSQYLPSLDILSEYNVILTTVTIAGKFAQASINYWHFEYVFIDEAGSCTEPSTLVPIAGVISSGGTIHGQVILSGDPMQLGPVVVSDKAKTRLGVSLLERLIDTGIYRRDPRTGKYNPRVLTKLLRNFRSHPKILEHPNKEYYAGELMAKGNREVTHWACDWKYLSNKSIPIVFEHLVGHSNKEEGATSLSNEKEIDRVIFNIQRLLSNKDFPGKQITQKCIGVISPYKHQCQQIILECKRRNWRDIEVGSVDKFQGQEKPVIILSTVRSKTRSVGFLNNPKRLNVALTRAQALLIIVGNADTLKRDPTWRKLIDFYRKNKVVKWALKEETENKDIDNDEVEPVGPLSSRQLIFSSIFIIFWAFAILWIILS